MGTIAWRTSLERLVYLRLGVLRPVTLGYSVSFQGICFIRTSRPENAVIYNNNEDFQIGQAKVSAVDALTSDPTECT